MKIKTHAILTTVFLLFLAASAHAEVETEIRMTLNLKSTPLNVVTSKNGRWLFVLTDQSEVLVYKSSGKLDETIPVGPDVDEIAAGPKENVLLLKSRKNKTVQVLTFESVRTINISGAPARGPASAPVVVAIFSDFQCPHCARLVPVIDQVIGKYPDQVRVAFKHYPLKYHKFARKGAIASLAAHRQGKFWEFHDRIFENYNQLDMKKIREVASGIGLDMVRFDQDIKDPTLRAQVRQDKSDARQAGVTGTPTVFVNGRRLKKRSLQSFYSAIEKELKRISAAPETSPTAQTPKKD